MDLEARIRRLEDRAELQELIAAYGRAVDDRDMDTLGAMYVADGIFDSTEGRITGRAEVVAYYRKQLNRYGMSYHYPHSHTIDFTGPDTATGIVCAHAELAIIPTPFVVALRYYDEYRREEGRWRFVSRDVQQVYAAPLADLPQVLATTHRKRWPGTEPAEADLPEKTATWQAYTNS
jgi:hypothetical protein